MKKILISALCLLFAVASYSQHAIGDWINFNSFETVTLVEESPELVYYVSKGFLYSYNKEDNSVSSYSKVEGLSDNDISFIHYSNDTKQLIVIYSNMNIDLIKGDKLYNISDVKDKTITGDKQAYHYSENNKLLLISTGFGLVILDLERREIKDSYNWGEKIKCSVINNNKIYISGDAFGIRVGDMSDNLSDAASWKTHLTDFAPVDFINIDGVNFCLKSNWDLCYQVDESNTWTRVLNYGYFRKFKKTTEDKSFIARGDGHNKFYIINKDRSFKAYTLPNNITDISSNKAANDYWCADAVTNLTNYKYDGSAFTTQVSEIGFNGVATTSPFHMSFDNGYLYVSGGGKYYDRYNYRGVVSIFDGINWMNTNNSEIAKDAGIKFADVVHTVPFPDDPMHVLSFTWGEGIFEFKDGKFVNLYSYKNSGVESIFANNANYHRVDGGAFDKDGNMWFTNSGINKSLKVLLKNGDWNNLVNFEYSSLQDHNSLGKVFISSRNYKWINVHYSNKDYGFFVIDNSGTPESPSSYKTKYLQTFTYSDGGSPVNIEVGEFKGWAEDRNGRIWVGTDKGPFILNNEANIFNENSIPFTRVKIPRNDGTDLADFLLENENIVSIVVDGANRKWLGTESNGVYLVSADGLEEIHHFTSENSPIPSDNILQLAIDNDNGILYIGTDKGLIGYQSDAVEGKEDYSEVYAFPNPVRPEYSGIITVTGLMENSLVKITDVNNNLIYQANSLGGMIGWNGLNHNGSRVATGVYFVYGTSEDGKTGVVTKILFVN